MRISDWSSVVCSSDLWDILDTIRGNRDFLAWAYDLGHGTIELRIRKRRADSPVYLAAWGSWELSRYLFGTDHSQLIYSADTGLSVFDMATRSARRIAGTSRGDRPYAISADQRLFAWSTRNLCGDESLADQDQPTPPRFCLPQLPTPHITPRIAAAI